MAKANANAKAKVTLTLTGTVAQLQKLSTQLEKMGITSTTEKKCEIIKVSKANKESKANEEFDRKKYEEIATELGVLGKHGVHKFARQTVYEAMAESKLTKKKIEEYKAKLNAIATEQNLTWFLGENVEIEEDEEELAFN